MKFRDTYTTGQVAKAVGCAARTVVKMCGAGEFVYYRVGSGKNGGDRRITRESVIKYFHRQNVRVPPGIGRDPTILFMQDCVPPEPRPGFDYVTVANLIELGQELDQGMVVGFVIASTTWGNYATEDAVKYLRKKHPLLVCAVFLPADNQGQLSNWHALGAKTYSWGVDTAASAVADIVGVYENRRSNIKEFA